MWSESLKHVHPPDPTLADVRLRKKNGPETHLHLIECTTLQSSRGLWNNNVVEELASITVLCHNSMEAIACSNGATLVMFAQQWHVCDLYDMYLRTRQHLSFRCVI